MSENYYFAGAPTTPAVASMNALPAEPARVLIVDDEASVRSLLFGLLCDAYACDTASSAENALDMLARSPYDVILSDIKMPGIGGIELLKRVLRLTPDATVIMVSANTDTRHAVDALRLGARDYIVKPFEIEEVELGVARALEHRRLIFENRRYQDMLERLVAERTADLQETNATLEVKSQALVETVDELLRTYRSTLRALASALDARDAETRGHSERVVAFSLRLGAQLGLSPDEMLNLERGALLHDIGKIGVRDAILLKPGSLTPEEWVEMRLHTEFGREILEKVPFLSGAIPVVAQHHERWNGSGYPVGLEGEAIDIKARVFSVADCIDAVTSDRPYRRSSSFEVAGAELDQHEGTQFDPLVVAAFHAVPYDEWCELRRRANEVSALRGEGDWSAITPTPEERAAQETTA